MRIEGQAAAVDYIKHDFRVRSEGAEEASSRMAAQGVNVNILSREKEKELNPEVLKQAVATANEAFRLSNYHLEFRLHENSGRYQIKVVDTDSNTVIREIPPEYMLEISARIREVLDKFLGVFVDALV
ncbi:FlaG protein [Thermosyntropha lipolytica DSM 11003]|uniref:FlaG protein n=1 Tax=Thermosyntropha lipolytica DSM 11003 TaxID=1123382 RepID=A0A1M5KPI4_9FIRM|nr:flagellar protein FlaG [Thermosyntropha lipolytica]SHG54093.1 FlaG protein [Thermosyntropha lipolytica DSM 11003]